MINVTVQPKRILVGDTVWSAEDIQGLKDLFQGQNSIQMDKRDIRNSDLIQKALKSEVVVSPSFNLQEQATLFISQAGLDLLAAADAN